MNKKIAFVFPGQGSQYQGMGQDLFANYSLARNVFEQADDKKPLSHLCFSGTAEELRKTTITQPALLTASTAAYQVLSSYGIRPDFVAGHSLGEYTALVAAEVLSFSQALDLVLLRSQLMENTVPKDVGAMAAILGLSGDEVATLCQEVSPLSWVEPANYNCPGQVVISGYKEGVEKAGELAKKSGARRVIPLAVSGPFHSKLMEPASRQLREEINNTTLAKPKVPVVANVTGEATGEPEIIEENLAKQVHHPVLWEESIRYLHQQGVGIFVEVGPGKVLSGLIKKTLKDVILLNVEDQKSLEKTLTKLGEGI